jgi:hypothetical protein
MENNVWTTELLKIAIPCFTGLATLIIFAIGARFKLWSSFTIGKNGLDVKAIEQEKKKKEEEKKFESGNFNKICDDQILKLDGELVDYALEQSNKLRRTLNIKLNKHVGCSGTRRSLASCLRYPLWEAARKNHFKDVLRPENMKRYVDRLLKEVVEEYHAFSIEREVSFCTINPTDKCPELPPLDSIMDMLKQEIIESWALPIRCKTYEISEKKISTYKQFLPSYHDLGDGVRVKVCGACIEKNEGYKKALTRQPEQGEI